MILDRQRAKNCMILGLLIFIHAIVCCYSLVRIAVYEFPIVFDVPASRYHIYFDSARLKFALASAAAFALLAPLLVLARFSFGYVVSFYFYTMVLSYLWLNCFSDLAYDHRLAGFSAAASAIAFFIPALFITRPVRQIYALSALGFDRLLTGILIFSTVTIGIGSHYNFRLVGIESIYDFRDMIELPTILSYLIGMISSTMLPFAFAGLVTRKAYHRAGVALFLLLCLYPVTLSKLPLLAPFWLIGILLLTKFFEVRIAVVLSLLGPIFVTVVLIGIFNEHAGPLLSTINFRMIAIPAVAMDVYSDFFSRHDLTYFCQVSFLKSVMHCPYQEALSLVMERNYKLGNFNASLFATEGIASVGTMFAPVSAFACGLVIAIGNRLSAGLPAPFILVSGAVIPQVLLNVQLSTVLLTHGAGLLFLLWYITPRSIFPRTEDLKQQAPVAAAH
jgi:hypothetical protein